MSNIKIEKLPIVANGHKMYIICLRTGFYIIIDGLIYAKALRQVTKYDIISALIKTIDLNGYEAKRVGTTLWKIWKAMAFPYLDLR